MAGELLDRINDFLTRHLDQFEFPSAGTDGWSVYPAHMTSENLQCTKDHDYPGNVRLECAVPGCVAEDVTVTLAYPKITVHAARKVGSEVKETYHYEYSNPDLPRKLNPFDAAVVRNGWFTLDLTAGMVPDGCVPVENG